MFAERLKIALHDNWMSQAELARKLGTYPRVVSSWLSGKSEPSAMYIRGICEVLNVSADWLLGIGESYSPKRKDEQLRGQMELKDYEI